MSSIQLYRLFPLDGMRSVLKAFLKWMMPRPLPDRATEEDVLRCYRYVLGREPDEHDREIWSNFLKDRQLDLRSLWDMFAHSPEAELLASRRLSVPDRATEDDVIRCYRYVLGRELGESDRGIWSNFLREQQMDLRSLWDMIERSPEAELLTSKRSPSARFSCVRADGFFIYVDTHDPLVGSSIAQGWGYEPHVQALLDQTLRPGDTFIDLGANMGYFTLLAAARVGKSGRVLAFEPRHENVALLTLSVLQNGFSQVDVHPVAVADRERHLSLYPDTGSTLSHVVDPESPVKHYPHLGPVRSVRAVALDDYLADLPRLDVVKIDVDGNEFRAFSGMQKLLARYRPVVIFEYCPQLLQELGGVRPEMVLELLISLDYRFTVIGPIPGDGRCLSDVQSITAAHQKMGLTHIDLLASQPCSQ